jgi:hypothetical protein
MIPESSPDKNDWSDSVPHKLHEEGEPRPKNQPSRIAVELERFMDDRHIPTRALADALGVPYAGLTACLRGERRLPNSPEVRRRAAELLGVSGLQIAIWNGQLGIEDFGLPQTKDHSAIELAALRFMRADPRVGYLMPSDDEWSSWPRPARISLMLTYQELTKANLLPAARFPKRPRPAHSDTVDQNKDG